VKEKITLTFLLLLIAIFSVITNVNASPAEPAPDDAAAAPPADESRTEDDGWVEGDYKGSLEEQEKQAQEDWDDAGRPGEDDNDIPNCDFDEFVNDDNECEKIPENPITAALPPCDGSLQNCVTDDGDVCLAEASTHECELESDQDPFSPVPFPSAGD
jgi:hypothetical protein